MKTSSIFLVIFCILSVSTSAQSGKYLTAFNNTTTYLNSGNTDTEALKTAYVNINDAAAHEVTGIQAKTWFYKGFINQLIFENKTLSDLYSRTLLDASEAYQKSLSFEDKKFRQDAEAKQGLANIAIYLYNRGIDLFQNKKYQEAITHFMEVKNISDFLKTKGLPNAVDESNALFNAALAADKLEDRATAKKILLGLLEVKYDNAYIYQALAMIYRQEKNVDKALETLALGIARYPTNIALIIDELNIYLANNREVEAIDKMKKAIELDPKNAQLHFALATTYMELKDENNAVASYLRAIEVDPKYFDAYNNLGALYLNKANAVIEKMNDPKLPDAEYKRLEKVREENLKKALPYIEKANEIKPNERDLLLVLREIYAKLGDYDKVKQIKAQIDKL